MTTPALRSLLPLLCATLALAATAGCSGDSASAACGQLFDAQASSQAQCGGNGLYVSGNRQTYIDACVKRLTAPGVAVTAGDVSSCADALASEANQCGAQEDPPACATPTGKLATGQPCGDNDQCLGGGCNLTAGSLCGVCVQRAAEGQSCVATACAPNLTCLGDGLGGRTCIREAVLPVGAPCSFSDAPGANCTSGSVCNVDAANQGTLSCQKLPTKGQACTTSGACAAGLVCVDQVCATAVPVGGSCPTGSGCEASLYCDPTSFTCAAYITAKAGAPCGAEGIRCGSGLYCASGSRVCVAYASVGQACSPTVPCQPFVTCANHVCTIPDPSLCK